MCDADTRDSTCTSFDTDAALSAALSQRKISADDAARVMFALTWPKQKQSELMAQQRRLLCLAQKTKMLRDKDDDETFSQFWRYLQAAKASGSQMQIIALRRLLKSIIAHHKSLETFGADLCAAAAGRVF